MDQDNNKTFASSLNFPQHIEAEQIEPCSLPKEGESEREEVEVGNSNIASLVKQCNSACYIADSENDVALECNPETPQCKHSVRVTELPDLVIEKILKHLDVTSKLALREVSHATKKWIDANSSTLNLFHLPITSNNELENLIKYFKIFPDAKWRRFTFTEKGFTSYEHFPSFVSIYSDRIRSLHLDNFDASLAQILFLSSCERLEYLKIMDIDLRENPSLFIASDKSLKAKCPKLLDIFTKLKELSIGIIQFNDVKHLPFYQTFLQRCRKLEKLNVPRAQGPNTISWELLKDIQLKYIIYPIKEYLQKKPMTSPIKSDIKVLDVEGLFSRHFPILAESCVQIASPTLFDNVNEKHVKYLFTHEGDILQRILSLREKIDDRRPICKWENLQRLHVRTSRCDIRNEYPGYVSYSQLKFLSIVMDSRSKDDANFLMLKRLIQLLVFCERKNLENFVLQWPLFAHDTPQDYIRAAHFVANFNNLTRLHVSGWTAPDDDFILIFNVLYKLKEIILEECLNLTDWGILGPADLPCPAIMNLMDLKRLEIKNRNNPGFLTDVCFERAFQHMRVNYFVVDSFHVTSRGYEFLMGGEYSTSIRRMPVPNTLPRGISTNDDFVLFVASHFPKVIL